MSQKPEASPRYTQLPHDRWSCLVVMATWQGRPNTVHMMRTESPHVICFPLRFHLMYKPPPTIEVQARLLQNPRDSEEHIRLQTDLFYRNCGDLEQYYDQAITVNGDQDPYTVFEYIESGIINPLPKKVT